MKRFDWKSEQGGSFIFVLAMVWAAFFLCFMFFDFYTVFAGKRIAQTGADAASIAAAQEMKRLYEAELDSVIREKSEDLSEDAHDAAWALVDEDTSFSEAWRIIMNRWDVPADLEEKLKNLDYRVNAEIALHYFYNDRQITNIICDCIYDSKEQIYQVAREYADKNGAGDDLVILFPYEEIPEYEDQPVVYVKTEKNVSFVTVPGTQEVPTNAAAKLKWLRGVNYISSSCTEWEVSQ
jgi:hypothetical protein